MRSMFKTALLLSFITALFVGVGAMIGGTSGMMMALMFAVITNTISYWFSDSIVLKMYRARPIDLTANRELYGMIQELAHRAEIPMPKAYLIDSEQPNAFATGRSPAHGAVAITTGLVRALNQRELAGVIAHELAHIKNRDTLTMTVTATIAGAISTLANFAMFFGGRGSSDGGRSSPLAVIAIALLAPFAAMLVQMAISRTREYSADATGAAIARDPLALASALAKIQNGAGRIDNIPAERNPATAHMFIINPLHAYKVDNLFSTHPSTTNRIEALQAMATDYPSAPAVNEEGANEATKPVKRGSFNF